MSKIFLGYRRVSRVGDRKETLISPEQQAEDIQALADREGLAVEILDAELDVSGGEVSRPILDAAIDRIETGDAAGLIVFDLSRLSRMDLLDALQTIARIEDADGKVISLAESFDSSTPEGEAARNFSLAINNMYRQKSKLAIARSKERAVAAGIWPISRVPRGYVKGPDRHLVPGPDAGEVRRAFEMRATGSAWHPIARHLGAGPSGAARIIANRVYLGEIRMGEYVNLAAHPAIVPRELWEAAQISQPRPPRGRRVPRLLVGIARCTGCQGSLSFDGNSYRCMSGRQRAKGACAARAMIRPGLLEPHVEAIVLAHLDVSVRGRQRGEVTDAARTALEEAEGELAAYQDAVRASEIGVEPFSRGLTSRLAAVEEARRDLAGAQLTAPVQGLEGDLAEIWPSLDVDRRRQVLRGALGVVWVRKGRGPVTPRVRVIAAGHEPRDLPRSGPRAFEVTPIEWPDGRLDGELGVHLREN